MLFKLLIPIALAVTLISLGAEQRSFEASRADRASACNAAKREAESAARRSGKALENTGACDCSRRELDPQSAEGIAAKSVTGTTVQWICQVDANFR